jgi:antitoxin CcdA
MGRAMKRRAKKPVEKRKATRISGLSEGLAKYRASTKRATNVSIDSELLEVAKSLGINLSETLEQRLRELTQEERERRWKVANRAFIESHNRYIEEYGVFGEDLRTW